MAKFNQPAQNARHTVNMCGFPAYSMEDKSKLVTMATTSMLAEPKFYGDNSDKMIELAERTDPAFVSRLAVYVRRELHLRSVAHALCAVVANRGKAYIRPLDDAGDHGPDIRRSLRRIWRCMESPFQTA